MVDTSPSNCNLLLAHIHTSPTCLHSFTVITTMSCIHLLLAVGSGRFSEVKQARHKQTKKLQALKVLKEGCSEEQFYRELCIGSRIKHRNLVTYHNGVHYNRVMAIAMD